MKRAMLTSLQVFQQYTSVVDALQQHFAEKTSDAKETISQYELSVQLESIGWLKERLPLLAAILVEAGFELTIKVTVAEFQVDLKIRNAKEPLLVIAENAGDTTESPENDLSPEATGLLIDFKALCEEPEIELVRVRNLLDKLAEKNVTPELSIRLFLNKIDLNNRLASHIPSNQRPKLISFLSQAAFARIIENILPSVFEKDFCQAEKRTLISLFDVKGGLSSDFLVICGREKEHEFDEFLKPLPTEKLEKVKMSLKFRQSQSLGVFNTAWLTPEIFELTPMDCDGHNIDQLQQQLQKFQPLLSAIYLADEVEFSDGNYRVEYRGIGKSNFPITYQELLGRKTDWGHLYELYQYAYDGVSADKLEIAQQFLSLTAEDVNTLCSKAAEVREATKKTYDRALIDKVEDYFKARQNIQERIQTAVTEVSNDAIGLSRDVSSDLYKIIGVVGLAIAGVFFKTELGLLAILMGFVVITVYLALVILYHLPTLNRAAELRKEQHKAYILSFDDVLGTKEINGFINNKNWLDASLMFSNRHRWANVIYIILLVTSVMIVIGAALLAWYLFWATPEIHPIYVPPLLSNPKL